MTPAGKNIVIGQAPYEISIKENNTLHKTRSVIPRKIKSDFDQEITENVLEQL